MPRVNRAETEKNRQAIEHAASRLVRERGLSVSVADLMGAVGLTPGGFYGHFESKDALNAIACQNALTESQQRWKRVIADKQGGEAARQAIADGYVSERSRAAPGTKCPLAALAVDVSREEPHKPVRDTFRAGFEELVDLYASTLPASQSEQARRDEALVQISTMVGALVLARATNGQAVSDELLSAVRAKLLAS